MEMLVGVIVLAALVGVLVWMFMRSARRERGETQASFWPQSSAGQLGAVVLGLLVLGLVMAVAG